MDFSFTQDQEAIHRAIVRTCAKFDADDWLAKDREGGFPHANLMAFKAVSLYDGGKPCGAEANAAKYLAGEAAFKACQTAIMTHGGMGYAKKMLGMPKSY